MIDGRLNASGLMRKFPGASVRGPDCRHPAAAAQPAGRGPGRGRCGLLPRNATGSAPCRSGHSLGATGAPVGTAWQPAQPADGAARERAPAAEDDQFFICLQAQRMACAVRSTLPLRVPVSRRTWCWIDPLAMLMEAMEAGLGAVLGTDVTV